MAPDHDWVDKPRWSADGKTLYLISNGRRSSFFNLWGQRFDPDGGRLVGEPFRITDFDSPAQVLLQDTATSELGIAAQRAVLHLTSTTGNVWMLEEVDR